ncbi:hypothetical protein CFP56_028043 [Quercus suber]|uniref:Uncharacterized protein n=1 Tax=Quercus suber TaxID=58331 RepID=A0AAW0JWS0_QUESU
MSGRGQTELFLPHRCEFFIERLALAAGLRTLAMLVGEATQHYITKILRSNIDPHDTDDILMK